MSRISELINQNKAIKDSGILDKIVRYTELLQSERKIRNIIGPKKIEDIAMNHILPSINLGSKIIGSKGIDIGSGNGLPGIIIGIVNPDKNILLLEPKHSRINFMKMVIQNLELNNIKLLCGRAENIGREKDYRGKFDFGTCRAVSNLNISLELMLPFLRVNGVFYLQVGVVIRDNIDNYKKRIINMGGVLKVLKPDNELIIEKIHATSDEYPRPWKKIIKSS